ncbi:MAG: family 10 glycosylhydrolase [Armatimonadota bacterium]|nr:family 10 glycosylhydrolase [Armatimonadota bacterium]
MKRCSSIAAAAVALIIAVSMFANGYAAIVERVFIDGFDYEGDEQAQAAWQPMEGASPVKLSDNGVVGKALILPCDFTQPVERRYWDKVVKLDLSRCDTFSIIVNPQQPDAIRQFTIYFRSGDGWYAGWFRLTKPGWQKVTLSKADFAVEGKPTGWHAIDCIRLSVWRGERQERTFAAVDELTGIVHSIAVVRGNLTLLSGSGEWQAVQRCVDLMLRLLRMFGVDVGVLNDTDVELGALHGRAVAIFPYNPHMSDAEVERTIEFINSGGKVIIFYSIQRQLAEALGIELVRYMRQERQGQFAYVRFNVKVLTGLPDEIAQGSWNINVVKPIRNDARVVGEWYDSEGNPTGLPALVVSANGAYMAHILLPQDEAKKAMMLVALLGSFVKDVWHVAASNAFNNIGRFAGFASYDECVGWLRENAKGKLAEGDILQLIAKAETMRGDCEIALKGGEFVRALRLAIDSNDLLTKAWFHAQPSVAGEFRALWCHSAFGIPGWTWERAIEWLSRHGFNAVFPNMLWGGIAYYRSDVLPVAKDVEVAGDQIEACVAAAKKFGVQVHVWKVNWNLITATKEFVERMRALKRTQKDLNGNDVDWLCPSHPDNFKLEFESMVEVVRKYDVDGIHFDYIRYPNANCCYCEGCRERFEREMGITVGDFPKGVLSGELAEKYKQWRCNQITHLVAAVSEAARKLKPNIKISAAVFRDYPRCRETVGQDWLLWVERGYLDFVCPMNYMADMALFKETVERQLKFVSGKAPLYPGIGASAPGLTPVEVVQQIQIARGLGAKGFIIFNYDVAVAENVLPALSVGTTAER